MNHFKLISVIPIQYSTFRYLNAIIMDTKPFVYS